MSDQKKKTFELSLEQKFEEVLELVQPMITSILRTCHIYKNHDYYRHIAAIAVWESWKKADSTKGMFSSYIYTTVRGRILNELSSEQRYQNNCTPMEDVSLNTLLIRGESIGVENCFELIDELYELLSNEEMELLLLLYVDGYSYLEVAQQLSVSKEVVKKRRMRLMAKIRKDL